MTVPELNPLEVRDRHIIVDGSEIVGGILLARAGIVVDVDENPAPYQKAMNAVDESLRISREWGDEISNLEVLYAVDRAARQFAPYNPRGYEALLKEQAQSLGLERLTNKNHIRLSCFIIEREGYFTRPVGGLCQQHTLLSGALIRLLQDRDIIGGSVSVQSTRPDSYHPDRHTRIAFIDGPDKYTVDAASGVRFDSDLEIPTV